MAHELAAAPPPCHHQGASFSEEKLNVGGRETKCRFFPLFYDFNFLFLGVLFLFLTVVVEVGRGGGGSRWGERQGGGGGVEGAIYHNATAAAKQRANPKDSEAAG